MNLHTTRSSACNNSINEPSLKSVRTFITMINKSGLKASPSWTQHSQKMSLIVSHQLKQQFYNLIKRHNPIPQIFWDTLLPQSKTNNFPWYPIKSLFQVNKYKRQLLIFGCKFFTKSPKSKQSLSLAKTRIGFYQYLPPHINTHPKPLTI